MLTFFKINDPYRVIFIAGALLTAWLIVIFKGALTIPELSWMIIGERLGGGNILYKDLWTDTGPMAAGVYWVLNSLFGRSQVSYQILAFVLVCYQSILFNRTLIKNESLSQPVYVPALIYACLSILSPDFMTLSPQLMANTFLLLALDFVFEHTMSRIKQDEKIQYIGFFLVIATLFYSSYFVFLIGFLLVLMIFTGTVIRRFFLIIYGFMIPLVMVGIYYWYRDSFAQFWDQFILADFFLKGGGRMTLTSMLVIALPPALFLLLSVIKLFGRIRYTNFQITLIQVIILLLVFAAIGYWLSPARPPHSLLIFMPFAAFLISHFFMLIRNRFTSEITFGIFLFLIIMWNIGILFRFSPVGRWIDYSDLYAKSSKWDSIAKDKRVMLLSPDINVLQVSNLSTPFLDWKVSSEVFENPSEYSNIVLVYQCIKEEKPEIIIDPKGVMSDFFVKMPSLKSDYIQKGEYWERTGGD